MGTYMADGPQTSISNCPHQEASVSQILFSIEYLKMRNEVLAAEVNCMLQDRNIIKKNR